jgi:hypothetical protein
MLIRVVLD